MPLACIVDEKLFCVHSGIGSSLKNIDEIDNLEKPIQVF